MIVNVRDKGATGNGVTDDTQAFIDALGDLPSPQGGVVYVPSGTYRLTSGLAWSNKPVVLRGDGTGVQPTAGTRLLFPAGVTGITIGNGTAGLGAFSRIEGLHIQGSDEAAGTNDGVVVQATNTQVVNCHVEGFGRFGVYVLSDPDASIVLKNANNWYVEKVRCSGNKGGGFATLGVDSNAGVAIALDADSNGGYGIYENSNLGNTYVGPHLSGNAVGGILIGEKSKNNRMLGIYKETDDKYPIVLQAGGGANNYIDFIVNETYNDAFIDLTSSKNNFIVTPLGGMHYNRLAVGTSSGLDVVLSSAAKSAALLRGTSLQMQSAGEDANWIFSVLANRRLSIGSAQGQAVYMENPVLFTNQVGFYNTEPVARPVLTYSRTGEPASTAAIRVALAQLGLVQDSTTP